MATQTIEKIEVKKDSKKDSKYFRDQFVTAGSTPVQLAEASLSGTMGFSKTGKPKTLEAWAKLLDEAQAELAEIYTVQRELKKDVDSKEFSHIHINLEGDSFNIKRLYQRLILNKSLTRAQTLKALKNS
tara:strand:- start:351 stop:737 length:387 start_codon:yes stop_codon:yes gene_type:complete